MPSATASQYDVVFEGINVTLIMCFRQTTTRRWLAWKVPLHMAVALDEECFCLVHLHRTLHSAAMVLRTPPAAFSLRPIRVRARPNLRTTTNGAYSKSRKKTTVCIRYGNYRIHQIPWLSQYSCAFYYSMYQIW